MAIEDWNFRKTGTVSQAASVSNGRGGAVHIRDARIYRQGEPLMKIGLMFANAGPFSKPELLGTLAQNAEKFGFESIWTVEHVVIPQGYKSPYPYSKDGKIPGGEHVVIPDPLLPLGYAAAPPTNIKLATGVVILPQRNPLYVPTHTTTPHL